MVALAEMCISGKIGASIQKPKNNIKQHEYFFGEDQSRYLIEVNKKNKKEVSDFLDKNSIFYELLGETQNNTLKVEKEFEIKLSELTELNTFWFKNYFKEN